MNWRDTLHELLQTEAHATQASLVRALARRGHALTQATVSRELATLGAIKIDGNYRPAPPADLPGPIFAVALAYGGGVALVRTLPAHAAVLAQWIDARAIDGALGTIAGDDTVLVALAHPDAFGRLCRCLGVAALHDGPAAPPRR